jgi:tetratricopeptide (TPR) repeat protein
MTGGNWIRIARRPELPPFQGIRSATLDGLLTALTQQEIQQAIFADLSLGAWRSHQLAQCVFGQLQIAWPLSSSPLSKREELVSLWTGDRGPADRESASVIGDWIDSEGRGDAAQRSGVLLAEILFGVMDARPLTLVLLVPRFRLTWRGEDLAFLHYLAHGARPQDRIILATADSGPYADECAGACVIWREAVPCMPRQQTARGLAALVPGVIDPETAVALCADGHPLCGGWLLVPPEWRRDPRLTSALDFDRLAAAAVQPWLRAFAHVYGNSYFVDPWFLCAVATRHLADGGHEIALQLMERAAACAQSPDDRASLRALMQGFEIALMRYDEVADAPDPSPALSPLLRGALMMTKGWGLAMMKQAQRAEPYVQGARDLLAPILGRNRQFLYLLNISALNRVNLGDIDGALAIEKEIEKASAAEGNRDYRLQYVNSINLARLYRRRNDFDFSSTYYTRAFATTEGARTENDLVYTNACIARLDTARGRHFDALLGWLRASLHWLSSNVPEALGWRVLSAVCGGKVQHSESIPLEDVADSLNSLLNASAEAAGVALDSETVISPFVPAFIRSDRIFAGWQSGARSSAEAMGANGFGVFLIQALPQPRQSGPRSNALAASVIGLMANLACAPDLQGWPTIVVDDGLGREMPITKLELLSTCLRLGVRRARYASETVEITSERETALWHCARVRLGPAVRHVELSSGAGRVWFKRYLPPRCLSAAETDLLAQVDGETPIVAIEAKLEGSFDEVLATVRTLEADRVVELNLDVS